MLRVELSAHGEEAQGVLPVLLKGAPAECDMVCEMVYGAEIMVMVAWCGRWRGDVGVAASQGWVRWIKMWGWQWPRGQRLW